MACFFVRVGEQTSWKANSENYSIFFDKMVSILIDKYSMSNTSFRFRHMFLLSFHSSKSHTTSCSSLMSHHQVNNKCNRVMGQGWRWLLYALSNFLLWNNMSAKFYHCSFLARQQKETYNDKIFPSLHKSLDGKSNYLAKILDKK